MTKMTLKNVERTINDIAKKQKEAIRKIHNTTVDNLLDELVMNTPIDTGEARASWSKQQENVSIL
jgi:hypothetical protein